MTEMVLEAEQIQPRTVAGVRFHKIGKIYHFDYTDYPDLQIHDRVIVETTRGRQMGEVTNFTVPQEADRTYSTILRRATPRDLILKQYWESKEAEALELCRRKANEFQISGVKFIAALYSFDGGLLTFLYTADEKASPVTRLWQELNRQFSAQLELRQIGPRDVAKLLGGFGACGELRCCSTFLTDFSPVSIKMAKMQGISLNPSEITGMCGRLRCCLVYEYEQYVAARAQLPKRNKRVGTPHGEGKVLDVLPLQDAVIVAVADGIHTVTREELIPLDEYEALAKKSSEPCTKHGDGPCECGAKPGKAAEAAASDADTPESSLDVASSPMLDGQSSAPRERRGRDDRARTDRRGRGDQRRVTEPRSESRSSARPMPDRPNRAENRRDKPKRDRRGEPQNALSGEGIQSGGQPAQTPSERGRNTNQRGQNERNPERRQQAPSSGQANNPQNAATQGQGGNKKSRRGKRNRGRSEARQNNAPRESQNTQGKEGGGGDGSTDGG